MLNRLNQYYVYFDDVEIEELNKYCEQLRVKNCVCSVDVGSLIISTTETVSDLLAGIVPDSKGYEVVKFVYSKKSKVSN